MAEMGYFFDQPKFTKAEYEGRLAKVRAEMKAKDIEVLILFSAKNFYYLTGYESGATYYQAMIITPTGIVLFLREMEKVIGDTTMTIGAENTVLWQDHWNRHRPWRMCSSRKVSTTSASVSRRTLRISWFTTMKLCARRSAGLRSTGPDAWTARA